MFDILINHQMLHKNKKFKILHFFTENYINQITEFPFFFGLHAYFNE
jgi:hypothetical protein